MQRWSRSILFNPSSIHLSNARAHTHTHSLSLSLLRISFFYKNQKGLAPLAIKAEAAATTTLFRRRRCSILNVLIPFRLLRPPHMDCIDARPDGTVHCMGRIRNIDTYTYRTVWSVPFAIPFDSPSPSEMVISVTRKEARGRRRAQQWAFRPPLQSSPQLVDGARLATTRDGDDCSDRNKDASKGSF